MDWSTVIANKQAFIDRQVILGGGANAKIGKLQDIREAKMMCVWYAELEIRLDDGTIYKLASPMDEEQCAPKKDDRGLAFVVCQEDDRFTSRRQCRIAAA